MKTVHGKRVLYTMAADAEYGPALRARIDPLITGVGPVEAAITVTRALCDACPDLVVSLGSAGSKRLAQAQVYQVRSVAYRDMDASAFGFAKGVTPFIDHPVDMPLPLRIPGLPDASLSTGANVVAGDGYDAILQDMVDMESFATLRCCQMFDVPLIGLRGISDGAEPVAGLDDWTQYLSLIDTRLAAAVDQMEAALPDLLSG